MKKITVLCFATLILSILALPAHAQDATATPVPEATAVPDTATPTSATPRTVRATIKQERMETREAIKDAKVTIVAEKCKLIEANVETKTSRFDSNKAMHQEQYTQMKERLNNLVTQLKAKGLDTTKLETDVATLNTKTDKFVTDYEAYITKLKDTKAYACGHSDGEFRSALQLARTAILPVRQDVIDIRSFYQTTIRPDLIALRTQLAKISPTESAPVSPSPVATQAAQ